MSIRRPRLLVRVPAALALLAALVLAAPAAGDPALRVPKRKLNRALHCQAQVRNAPSEPVLLLTGTGGQGSETWTLGPNLQAALLRAGHSSCYLNFPHFTTGDIQ